MDIIIHPKISESCKNSSLGGDIIASWIIAKITENPAFNFSVPRRDDCGNNMNSQFLNYYKYRFFESDEFDKIKFNEEASKFLIQNNQNYIKFFRNLNFKFQLPTFNIYIIDKETHYFALDVVKEFENKNTTVPIHKGTPYHMLGVSYINDGHLLKGFLYVHQALKEDIRIGHSTGAALPLVTLDSQNAGAGKISIQKVEQFIDDILTKYNRGSLTFYDFRLKFLGRRDIQDIVFKFVYTAFRLKEMVDIDRELMQNDFAALSQKDIIFDFCTIIENIIKTQDVYVYPNEDMEKRKTIKPLLEFLSEKESLIIHECENLREINKSSIEDFPKILQNLLDSQYIFLGNKQSKSIDEDLAITYILRNKIHEIKSWPIIYENFTNIFERILNCLFFSIEKLHKRHYYYWEYEMIIKHEAYK